MARRYAPNPDCAYDVTQDTFLSLLDCFPPNGPGIVIRSSLAALLYVIARNAGISARRRASPLVADGLVSSNFVVAEIVEPTDFGRILARLPDAQQEVILLRFVGAFRLQEIADLLGIPLGTVNHVYTMAFAESARRGYATTSSGLATRIEPISPPERHPSRTVDKIWMGVESCPRST